ncbi:hypothetical protein AYI70_g7239 [Smittium culicis]|uniref:Uncharacterized protein n=1 Tax=Smittium culicis TaxID=133412 RepID=A0A1R1XLI8_9FUNG|nr:hypothetical protein AYI70_g7239 [Smittium culicis]
MRFVYSPILESVLQSSKSDSHKLLSSELIYLLNRSSTILFNSTLYNVSGMLRLFILQSCLDIRDFFLVPFPLFSPSSATAPLSFDLSFPFSLISFFLLRNAFCSLVSCLDLVGTNKII